ncbi:MAG: ROK family protein [Bacillota bacterium]
MHYYIGVDLGGTKIRVALAGVGDQIVAARSFPTGAGRGAAAVLQALQGGINELLAGAGCSRHAVAGIGVCAAGFYDREEDIMVHSPNLPGWDGLPLRRELEELFGLPVIVENDASAAAYGEYRHGAGRGQENLLLLTLGTGIGGGLVLGGKLYGGSRGFAGEIGHIPMLPDGPRCGCGRSGCLEALASGTAIALEGRKLLAAGTSSLLREKKGDAADLGAADVFEAARRGDGAAGRIIEQASFFLGRALAIAANILNPGIIILSGGMAASGDQLFEAVRRHFYASVSPPIAAGLEIAAAQLGADSGILGILALLREYLSTQ